MTQIKEKLLAEIEMLPEHRVADVIDFIHYLQYQEQHLRKDGGTMLKNGEDDPIRQFIGGIEHGHLAQNIDKDIYNS